MTAELYPVSLNASVLVAFVGGVLLGLAVGGPIRRRYYQWHIRRVHRARVLAALRQEEE